MIRILCERRTTFLMAVVALASWSVRAQTSVSASLYGAFSGSMALPSTSNVPAGGLLSPSNQAGALIELRHIKNPLVGYEATYAYNRANQSEFLNTPSPPACPTSKCLNIDTVAAVPANAHAITGNWIVSAKLSHLRPFALAGGGVLFHVPAADSVPIPYVACSTNSPVCEHGTTDILTKAQTRGVFVYGAGVDWDVLPHLGLRLQYRESVYKLSSLLKEFSSESVSTHAAEPMLGLYFNF